MSQDKGIRSKYKVKLLLPCKLSEVAPAPPYEIILGIYYTCCVLYQLVPMSQKKKKRSVLSMH